MTSAADPLFVDTNVLVYASWAASPLHTHACSVLATYRNAGTSLYISRQIIREWLATLNRPRTGLALVDLIHRGSVLRRALCYPRRNYGDDR